MSSRAAVNTTAAHRRRQHPALNGGRKKVKKGAGGKRVGSAGASCEMLSSPLCLSVCLSLCCYADGHTGTQTHRRRRHLTQLTEFEDVDGLTHDIRCGKHGAGFVELKSGNGRCVRGKVAQRLNCKQVPRGRGGAERGDERKG